jgi:hypothetical protein
VRTELETFGFPLFLTLPGRREGRIMGELAAVSPAPRRRRSGKRLTLSIPPELHKAIKEMAKEDERSVAAQIRYVLRKVTEDPNLLD